jgi:hypothetical protein
MKNEKTGPAMKDTKLENAYKAAEEKRRRAIQSAEDKRRHAAILGDRDTIPMDFSSPPPRLCAPAGDQSSSSQPDPLWKRVWRTEGIRYLGRHVGIGVIDAMERFEHAFMLGYRHGVGDMLGEAQWLIKEGQP